MVRLTSPSIWICFTGESKEPPTEAITALGAELGSLREAIHKPTHAEKGRKYFADGRFRYESVTSFPIVMKQGMGIKGSVLLMTEVNVCTAMTGNNRIALNLTVIKICEIIKGINVNYCLILLF